MTVKLTLINMIVSDPFPCIFVCITIYAMLNFDSDTNANTDVKCEQTLTGQAGLVVDNLNQLTIILTSHGLPDYC